MQLNALHILSHDVKLYEFNTKPTNEVSYETNESTV